MHAVVVKVTVRDREAAESALRERVIPQISGAPGFVAGYWTRGEGSDTGLSMIIVESEEAAQAVSQNIQSPDEDAVTIDDVEVREVVASA